MNLIRMFSICLILTATFLTSVLFRCAAAEPSSTPSRRDQIMIVLRPNVEAGSRVLRLGDIATISGGDPALRSQLMELDLDDAPSGTESLTILPAQIEFRLRLEGIDVKRISIRGDVSRITSARERATNRNNLSNVSATVRPALPAEPSISAQELATLEREVIDAAKLRIASKLPWPADSLDVRLALPLPTEARQIRTATDCEFSAELQTTGPALGRVSVRMTAQLPQKPPVEFSVIVDVRHFDQVVLATKTIERGHVISAADVYVDRRDVSELGDYCASTADVIGATAKRPMRALMPIRSGDFEAGGNSDKAVVIHRRDQVKMVAKLGSMKVSAVGEALQEGKRGETIRLRNVDSNANVQARIISASEVEVIY